TCKGVARVDPRTGALRVSARPMRAHRRARLCQPHPAAMTDSSTALTALSPLDGRYAKKVAPLAEHFSEFGLIRARVRIEIAWLIALSEEPAVAEVPPFGADARAALDAAASSFSTADAERV